MALQRTAASGWLAVHNVSAGASLLEWKNGAMALRRAAASGLEAERCFRKILGYETIWMLRAAFDRRDQKSEGNAA